METNRPRLSSSIGGTMAHLKCILLYVLDS